MKSQTGPGSSARLATLVLRGFFVPRTVLETKVSISMDRGEELGEDTSDNKLPDKRKISLLILFLEVIPAAFRT
jgi:hypothetical protein